MLPLLSPLQLTVIDGKTYSAPSFLDDEKDKTSTLMWHELCDTKERCQQLCQSRVRCRTSHMSDDITCELKGTPRNKNIDVITQLLKDNNDRVAQQHQQRNNTNTEIRDNDHPKSRSSNSVGNLNQSSFPTTPLSCRTAGHPCDCRHGGTYQTHRPTSSSYTEKETCLQLKGKTILFTGDSLIRDVWTTMAISLLKEDGIDIQHLAATENHVACMVQGKNHNGAHVYDIP